MARPRIAAFRALALCLALAGWSASARAGVTAVRAGVSKEKANVGERVNYTIVVEGDGDLGGIIPSQPDLGGLKLIAGPSTSQQTVIVNFKQSATVQVQYLVTSLDEGQFVIGPAQFQFGGQTYTTNPVKLEFVKRVEDPAAANAIPPSLRSEPLLFPNCDNAEVADAFRGRMFLRPQVSKANPYVGEVFVFQVSLYIEDNLSQAYIPRNIGIMQYPKFDTLLKDEEFKAQTLNTHTETIDGRNFQVSLLYRIILTAPKPGPFALEGLGIRFAVQSSRGRSGGQFDSVFDEPFFGARGVPAELWAGAVKINVRPLPDPQQPGMVAPSVGQYTLVHSLDRKEATQDDILTLTLKLSGYGNAALASLPEFPKNPDFEKFDQTQKSEKKLGAKGLEGSKTIEYLLRPLRAGKLAIPEIAFQTFDPEAGVYKTLKVPATPVEIKPGASAGAPPVAAGGSAPPAQIEQGIHYIKPVIDVTLSKPSPLIESPFFWVPQIGALAAAAASLLAARRRERMDPAESRRARAEAAFDKKLAKFADGADGALALERAIREYVADRHNASPEGLTAEEILKLLKKDGLAEEPARRVTQIVGLCAAARYAPAGAEAGKFGEWAAEAASLLKGGAK